MIKKIVLGALLLAFISIFFIYDLSSYLRLEFIKEQQTQLASLYGQHPFIYILVFSFIYILTTALSFPGATILTLLAGALFGTLLGTVIVSFASSIGATLAFLGSRWFLRETINKKFSQYFLSINKGVEKNGTYYLFTLRLTPVVPFFIVNLVMGLTTMKAFWFYIISQVGMLPGTVIYVNAGTQLANINSVRDVLSLPILLSLLALGLFPLVIKKILDSFKIRKIYKKFKKPKKWDYNLIVIGAGSAGLVTSYIAAAAKAKVALIEKHKMGGDCLNTGCIPSKTLIRTGKFLADVRKCADLGVKNVTAEVHFKDVMDRVQRVIKTIEPHDSIERYTKLGVECFSGDAKVLTPWSVEVNGRTHTTKNIVIASGASPFLPDIQGLRDVNPLTSDSLWSLKELPQKLLVLGAGPIGLELAQSFARLGSEVTLVEKSSRLLLNEDPEVSKWLTDKLQKEGVRVLTDSEALSFEKKQDAIFYNLKSKTFDPAKLQADNGSGDCSAVLVATGRKANTAGFGLEDLGVDLRANGSIIVNDKLQTSIPNIYACGDVTGMYQFTHTAAYQAWFASLNPLLTPFYSFKANYDVIPWCIYTDPEVARVGLNETQAQEKNVEYQTTFYNTDHADRALTEESAYGFVKILTAGKSDKILGVTIVGLHAGECLAEFVLAMKCNIGLNKILQTIHTYPTLTESNKMAAGQWKKMQLSESLLGISQKFHSWRRQ